MTTITFNGTNSAFFMDGLVNDGRFGPDIQLGTVTPTQVVLHNEGTGIDTTLVGSGFTFNDVTGFIGVLNSLQFHSQDGAVLEGSITNLQVGMNPFLFAVDEFRNTGNFQQLATIFDATPNSEVRDQGVTGFDMRELFGETESQNLTNLSLLTQSLTIFGGSNADAVYVGGGGGDYFEMMPNPSAGLTIRPSLGNDTIDFSNVMPGGNTSYHIDFSSRAPLNVFVGVTPGTGSIEPRPGFGVQHGALTFLNGEAVMMSGGLELTTSTASDFFEIALADQQLLIVNGGRGDDEITADLAAGSTLRLNYETARSELNLTLSTGRIADQQGGIDELNITGTGQLQISASRFDDILRGTAGNDSFLSIDGEDRINTFEGNDVVDAGNGNDEVFGGDGNDRLLGGNGFDTLRGDAGDDTLLGGNGADSLIGSDGDDLLVGARGFDQLIGGIGDDTLDAGETADRAYGGEGNDVIWGGSNVGFTVDGLFGQSGNDTIYGQGGYDLLDGGFGDDVLDGGNQADNLFGAAGADLLIGGQGFDRLFGGVGEDTLQGGTGTDGLFGQAGNDTLEGGSQSDRLFGGTGNDDLMAGDDNDVLFGGAGFDRIDGGAGDDQLEGNFNADTFVFGDGHGNDTITDFATNNAFERIDLSSVTTLTSLDDLQLDNATSGAATQSGMDVLIETGTESQIVLINVSLDALDVSDFIF